MITEIRVLPPLVIARLGSSPEPLENYDLELPKDVIGHRRIVPAETLYIGGDGSISRASVPPTIVCVSRRRPHPACRTVLRTVRARRWGPCCSIDRDSRTERVVGRR